MRPPDFAIVGPPKTGTSALWAWLREHPGVYMPEAKELHFFDAQRDRGVDWYLELFEPAGTRLTGEATTTYLAHPSAIRELAELNPDIRIVAVVRDPVDRAWSQYNYGLGRTWYTDSFEARVVRELGAMVAGETSSGGLINGSMYGRHLVRATEHVPVDQMLVLEYDEIDTAPLVAFEKLCRFLGVDAAFRPANLGSRENETRHVRYPRLFDAILRTRLDRVLPAPARARLSAFLSTAGYPALDPTLRDALATVFEADQASLARFLHEAGAVPTRRPPSV